MIEQKGLTHDSIAQQVEDGLSGLRRVWKKRRKITPFVITWPLDTVYTNEGRPVSGPCLLELPQDRSKWEALLKETVRTINPYGLLIVEQREHDVQAAFETRHGTKCWIMPIIRSGGDSTLGESVVTTSDHALWLADTVAS